MSTSNTATNVANYTRVYSDTYKIAIYAYVATRAFMRAYDENVNKIPFLQLLIVGGGNLA